MSGVKRVAILFLVNNTDISLSFLFRNVSTVQMILTDNHCSLCEQCSVTSAAVYVRAEFKVCILLIRKLHVS